jgi:hypothetical protein
LLQIIGALKPLQMPPQSSAPTTVHGQKVN